MYRNEICALTNDMQLCRTYWCYTEWC